MPILNIPDVDTRQKRSDHQALLDDVRRGWHAKLVFAQIRQARIAKAMEEADVVHARGALGERTMCVDPVIYWEMVRRYGPECWSDKTFRKDMLRDEPSLRVRSRARNLTLRVQGRRSTHGVREQAASACARTEGGILLA